MKHQARKRFGQHFLVDQSITDGIVRAVNPRRTDFVIEIGPGLSALTRPLLEQLDHLHVVEIDRDLAAKLRRQHSPERLSITEADVLQVDFTQFGPRQRIVGNLPYNISSPLLFHLRGVADLVYDQHFMLQREVIDRMVARPSTSDYGRLTVMLQWRYAMENVLFVPPDAFDPPPRVDSAVVRMVPLAEPAAIPIPLMTEMVQVAFSQRRKLLRHTLGRWLEEKAFGGVFDVQRRAEEVPVDEYLALALQLVPKA